MRRLIDAYSNFDPKAWRRYGPTTDPFGTLLCVVIGQQVSTNAARAMLGRLSALFGDKLPIPSELLAAEEEELRSVGLSRQKLSYLRNLAERVESSALDLDAGGVHRLQDTLSSLPAASYDGRPSTACAAESPSSRSKPRRQLGHAGIHPCAAFARALLAPGILVP